MTGAAKIELVHVHVPKCAGMAFRAALARGFGAEPPGPRPRKVPEVFAVGGVGLPICNTAEMAARFVDGAPYAVRWVTGHSPLVRYAGVTSETLYICPLRDPIDRLISWGHFAEREGVSLPFERMLATGQAGMHGWRLDNVLTRTLGGWPLDMPADPGRTLPSTGQVLARVRDLDVRFFWASEIERAVEYVALRMGWATVPEVTVENAKGDQPYRERLEDPERFRRRAADGRRVARAGLPEVYWEAFERLTHRDRELIDALGADGRIL